MIPRKPRPARELAARALCRIAGHPEDTRFQGRPLWESFLPEAHAVLKAIGWVEKDKNGPQSANPDESSQMR